MTRAKAAALETSGPDLLKKAGLTRTKSVMSNTNASQARKRAAMGDISNVASKNTALASKDGKKKSVFQKPTATTAKAPTGIQKATSARVTTTEKVLQAKKITQVTKRPAQGGVSGHVNKKLIADSTKISIQEDDEIDSENTAPQVTQHSLKEESLRARVEPQRYTRSETEEVMEEELRGLPLGVPDLDAEDMDDPLMVAEYVNEIFDYLLQLQEQTMANPDYMNNQPDLQWQMRGILVDWLLEVHTRFRLLPETLFLAVNLIDRFLSTKIVQLDRLQLVGVTAMFIASKYEEVLSPHVSNFRHVADDGFSDEEILSAERYLLGALNYDLSYPNPMNFLRRISKADNYDVQTRTLGKYLLEISCLDHRFIGHTPHKIAAAAMYLARLVLERGPWVRLLSIILQLMLTFCRMTQSPTMLAAQRMNYSHAST